MIYLLFSADYELYLGGNYVPEKEVLIDQSEKLINICNKINVPLTLFCDILCLWRYRELGLTDFPNEVEKQLKEAIIYGNDVQTHVHPHWNTLKINNMNYEIDSNTCLLGQLGENKAECYSIAVNILTRCKEYLEKLLQEVDSNYKCIAYRAGGYGLQPNEDVIIEALIDSGYLIGPSVVPGMYYKSNFHNIDFRNIPNLANYFISKEYSLTRPSDRGIFEIPIPGENASIISLIKNIIIKIKNNKLGRRKKIMLGYPMVSMNDDLAKSDNFMNQLMKKMVRTINLKGWHFLEIGEDDNLLIELTKKYIDKYFNKTKDIYFSVSCHPKALNDYSFYAIEKYFEKINKIYGDKIKPITFRQAADVIFNQGNN